MDSGSFRKKMHLNKSSSKMRLSFIPFKMFPVTWLYKAEMAVGLLR